jgi:NAD(P)-dependent dehydrogenase (short-subunit alcohol dehydrogenase family)
MSLKGKNALVLGATGVIGSGAAFQLLNEGATVVVVSRTESKLQELIQELGADKDRLVGIVAGYGTKKEVEQMYAKVKVALKGASPDHVVSSIGFAAVTPTGIIDADLTALQDSFSESLFPNILTAQVILADIRDKEGATFTLVSGGLAHKCYFPGTWAATIKTRGSTPFSCHWQLIRPTEKLE